MRYQEILPIPALQPYIRYFWVLESRDESQDYKQFKTLPDGIPALIYQETANLFRNEQQQYTPQLYVYGTFSTYTNQLIKGPFRVIGAYLEPTALKAIFKVDASDLANQMIELDDLVVTPLFDQLQHSKTIEEIIGLLSQFVWQQIQEAHCENKKATLASILLQRGQTLAEIQHSMNVSERTLERLVKQHIGISPKLFSRIMRFQTSLKALKTSGFENLTSLAHTQEYCDQSHFIREFKGFTGSNPTQFLRHSEEKLSNFPQWKKEE